jgi:hypothetical protein
MEMTEFRTAISLYIVKKGVEYRTKLSKVELRAWVEVCETYFKEVAEAIEIIDKFFASHEFGYMPKVEQFKRFLKNGAVLDDEIDLISQEAWNIALDTAIIYGDVPVDFEDKLINVTIRKIGGWSVFHNAVAYSSSYDDLRRRDNMQGKFLFIYRKLYKTKYFRPDETKGLIGYKNSETRFITCETAKNSRLIVESKALEHPLLAGKVKELISKTKKDF